MTTEHPTDPEVASAVAAQLEQLLGEVTLTVGTPTDVTVLTSYPNARAIAMPFTIAENSDASMALVALEPFAERIEAALGDDALGSGAVDLDAVVAADSATVFPILEGSDVCALLVLAAGEPEPAAKVEASPPDPYAPGAAASSLLSGVELGVTAELGRCQMTLRELLSVTPGSVVDLDRAAGAMVDVLANGTVIARGEVVVIDDEFGIRILEINQHAAD